MTKFMEKLLPYLQKFAAQRHLHAIKDGMMAAIMPTLVGSIFLIFRFLPIPAYLNFMDNSIIGTWLLYPVAASMDIIGLVVLIAISYRLSETYKIEALGAVITAIMSYILITPLKILVDIPNTAEQLAVNAMPLYALGTRGLFVGIIVSLAATEIYHKVVQSGLTIKMPDSVPPAVSKSFIAVVPATAAILAAFIVRVGFENTHFGDIHKFITEIMSAPLIASVDSIWGIMFYSFAYSFFWSLGIHGAVTDAVYKPIFTVMRDANRMAFQAGEALPYIANDEFLYSMVHIGGTGSTIVLVVMCLFFARSQQLTSVGKLALGPSLFQINEPILFGIPIVLNPIMMIPLWLCSPILSGITYLAVSYGLVSKPTGVAIPWTTPTFLNAFMQTNGDFRIILLQAVNLALAAAIYYPFFKIVDKAYSITETDLK